MTEPHGKSNLLADKIAELVWQGREDIGPRILIVDTQAENWAQNWKAIAEQTAPDDQPTP